MAEFGARGSIKTDRAPKTRPLHPYRRCGKPLTRFQWASIVVNVLTLIVVGGYAWEAWVQADQAKLQVEESSRAISAVHENAVKDLRAYMGVGDRDAKMAEVNIDPKTGDATISVYFFNGGRTPAHHFMANIWTHVTYPHDAGRTKTIDDIKREGPHIERFEYQYDDGSERSSSGGFNVAANSPHFEKARNDGTLTRQDIQATEEQSIPNAAGVPQYSASLRVFGTYEYCDEFGGYHCNELDLVYDAAAKKFSPNAYGGYMDLDCNLGLVRRVPLRLETNTFLKPLKALVLSRCEKPLEQEQAQREADQTAGRTFPISGP